MTVPAHEARNDAKRQEILESALDVFVARGYVGTSTDQLAAVASVSKQTLYKLFGDKEGVFTALIKEEADRVVDPFAPLTEQMADATDADAAVGVLGEQFARSITTPRVQHLRRLVIAEATRFPELGQMYWERGFLRTISSVARCLEILDRRGLLCVPDAEVAAHHFAGLLLWMPSNQVMFAATTHPLTDEQVTATTEAGVAAFMRAYQRSVEG